MSGLLTQLGGWTVDVVEGRAATRARILAALDDLADGLTPDATVLFYFFGHGGAVRFIDGPTELRARTVYYISAARSPAQTERTGVLDVELGQRFACMDALCGNVSAILDCCHSAAIVRGTVREIQAPSWVYDIPRDAIVDELAWADGHPRIVRLTGTSSLRTSYRRRHPNDQLGLLTEGFTAVVREAGVNLGRLTWDSVVHRVREHAIQALRWEEQWVTLAGPRGRLLFSREQVALPRTVGYVDGREAGHGWLRAGALQGVEVGDEWGITALTLDVEHQPRILARVRVVATDLNRAEVEHIDNPGQLVDGSAAIPTRAREPFAVCVEAQLDGLHRRIDHSALLCIATPDQGSACATVRELGRSLQLRRELDGLELTAVDDSEVLAILGDWGRAHTLERALDRCMSAQVRPPIHVRWCRVEESDVPLSASGVELCEGQHVAFELVHAGLTPEPWYVCAIQIDAAGRPVLLNSSEPNGLEIQPRMSRLLGRRAHHQRSGIVQHWPKQLIRPGSRPVDVVFLMSLRPIELGHLARLHEQPLARPRRRGVAVRGGGLLEPVLTAKWAFTRLRYTLMAP